MAGEGLAAALSLGAGGTQSAGSMAAGAAVAEAEEEAERAARTAGTYSRAARLYLTRAVQAMLSTTPELYTQGVQLLQEHSGALPPGLLSQLDLCKVAQVLEVSGTASEAQVKSLLFWGCNEADVDVGCATESARKTGEQQHTWQGLANLHKCMTTCCPAEPGAAGGRPHSPAAGSPLQAA